MHSFISALILWISLVFLCVQSRSIDKIKPTTEDKMSENSNDFKQRFSKQYLQLLADLKNQESTSSEDNNNDNDLSSTSTEEEEEEDDEQKQLLKRAFFLFPRRRSNQRPRPIYTYGRKSHWDTFFG